MYRLCLDVLTGFCGLHHFSHTEPYLVRRLIEPSLDTAIAEVKRHEHDSYGLLKSLLPYRSQLAPFEKRLRQGVTF